MPKRINIGGTLVEYDPDATREAYAKVNGGINSCKCEYCLNYRLVREQIYPPEFRDLLEELGIDYRKEVELNHLSNDDSDDSLAYGQSVSGNYAFVGRVLEDRALPSQDLSSFDYGVSDGDQVHPVTCAMFGSPPFIDLNFWVPYVPKAANR